MIRDNNPAFQYNVEKRLLDSLTQKYNATTREKEGKLINWSIYNAGKQTIIVL